MSTEEWEKIKLLFDSALRLPIEKREDFLETACPESPDLRETVRSLLRNHEDRPSSFLEETVPAPPRPRVFADGQLVAGRFRIVRFINRGGMGEVYEAYDERLHEKLALKTLRPELAADRDALGRFEREIRVAREVAHESLCRIHDLVEHPVPEFDAVIPCLTMQLLEGESMREFLDRSGPVELGEALYLFRQIAQALDVLHGSSIIHRDLKPSNIMLVRGRTGERRAVVTDFGLARALRNDAEMFETLVDARAGAPYFMSPELLRGARHSQASDIYALGLILDQLVTKSRPFTAESVQALMYQKLWETPIPPGQRADSLPASWEYAILRCIDAEPTKRFTSGMEVVEALERPAPPPTLELHPPARALTRRGLLAAAIAVPAATGVGVLANLTFSPLHAGIVVFDFLNSSSSKDNDYICTGTRVELLRRLNYVNGVRARNFQISPAAAPKNLDDRFLLRGLLNGSLKLGISLVDGVKQRTIWQESFDCSPGRDLVRVLDKIAKGILSAIEKETVFGGFARALMPVVIPIRRLVGKEEEKLPPPPTTKGPAFEGYMRAKALLDDGTDKSAYQAIDDLKLAVKQDPNFALAYFELTRAQFILWDFQRRSGRQLLREADQYASKAIAIDPGLAEAQLAYAAVRQMYWEWAAAGAAYQEALRLNPKSARVHRWYAGLRVQFADFGLGLAEAREAIRLQPYELANYVTGGLLLYFGGQYKEAIQNLQFAIKTFDTVEARHNLADIYLWLGHSFSGPQRRTWFQKALEQIQAIDQWEIAHRDPSEAPQALADGYYAHYYALLGDRAAAQPYIDRLEKALHNDLLSPEMLAIVYLALGDREKAISMLQWAYVLKDRKILYIAVDPFWREVRSEPRIRQVLEQMQLV